MTQLVNTAVSPSRISSTDVAKEAGVGQMTVSRVFSGKGYVADKTRDKVLEAAQKLNYRPNLAAAAMNTGRFGSVTLLCSNHAPWSMLPQNTLMGLDQMLNEQDMHLIFSQLAEQDLSKANEIPKALRTSMTDGMLINYNAHIPENLIDLVEQNRIPAVWINAKFEQCCVYPDEEQAGFAAAEYLLKMGHRRIAFLCSGWPDPQGVMKANLDHFSVIDRQAGYSRAMKNADLQPDPIVVQTQLGSDLHVQTFTQLLRQPNLPTAIIANSHAMAGSICLHAMQLGIKVPSQLSVMTFQNEFQPAGSMAIDAMCTPDTQVGQVAGQMILSLIKNPKQNLPASVLPCTLRVGQTCVSP